MSSHLLIMSIKINKINNCMTSIKVLLGTAAFCSALLAVLMLWNIEALSCDITTAKCFITMFIISAIVLTKEVASINTSYEKQV